MAEDEVLPRTNPARRRQYNRAGKEHDYFLFIVCTDRGQHKRILLTTARRSLTGERGMNHALVCFAPPMKDAEPDTLTSRESYVFRCPKCGRTPHIRNDRWWALIESAVRADLDDLDLSLLPF